MLEYEMADVILLKICPELCGEEQVNEICAAVSKARKSMLREYGILIPLVRIVDDKKLHNEWEIYICNVLVGKFAYMQDKALAIDTGNVKNKLKGVSTRDPSFNMSAIWISKSQEKKAKKLGYIVSTLSVCLAVHLKKIFEANIKRFVTSQAIETMLQKLSANNGTLVARLENDENYVSKIRLVLQNLLENRIPVCDIISILETICDNAKCRDALKVINKVRLAIAPTIISRCLTDENTLYAVSYKANQVTDDAINKIVSVCSSYVDSAGFMPVIVCPLSVIYEMQCALKLHLPINSFYVISHEEVGEVLFQFPFKIEIISEIETAELPAVIDDSKNDIEETPTVVLTDGESKVIGFSYDSESMPAPKVVLKNRDVEECIKSATKQCCCVISNKNLAKQIYENHKIGDYVDEKFFQFFANVYCVRELSAQNNAEEVCQL